MRHRQPKRRQPTRNLRLQQLESRHMMDASAVMLGDTGWTFEIEAEADLIHVVDGDFASGAPVPTEEIALENAGAGAGAVDVLMAQQDANAALDGNVRTSEQDGIVVYWRTLYSDNNSSADNWVLEASSQNASHHKEREHIAFCYQKLSDIGGLVGEDPLLMVIEDVEGEGDGADRAGIRSFYIDEAA